MTPSRSTDYRAIASLILELLGVAVVTTGVSMIYLPAGVIVAGILLFAIALALDPPKKAPKGGSE